MNYKKIYDAIIFKRLLNPLLENEYGEYHHIIPKSLGGSNDETNLIKLSSREHFICHALLAEMYPKNTNEWYKMNHAFMMMKCQTSNQIRYINNRIYELKKIDFSESMSYSQGGNKNSQYGTIWVHNVTLKKNIKISHNQLSEYEKHGWEVGRQMNWINHVCLWCGNCFKRRKNKKLCSKSCKELYFKKLRKPTDIISKIEDISSKYSIIFGSLAKNEEFIVDCMKHKCSKNQICIFLKVNNSGANYNYISEIYSRSSMD